MSKVSDLYDEVVRIVGLALPDSVRMPTPTVVEVNMENILRQGFGVRMNGGNNTERFVDTNQSVSRRFTVILSREAVMLEGDADAYANCEKAIYEDGQKVIVAMHTAETLQGVGVSFNTKYVSDGGVDMIAALEGNGIYLVNEYVFETEYFEEQI